MALVFHFEQIAVVNRNNDEVIRGMNRLHRHRTRQNRVDVELYNMLINNDWRRVFVWWSNDGWLSSAQAVSTAVTGHQQSSQSEGHHSRIHSLTALNQDQRLGAHAASCLASIHYWPWPPPHPQTLRFKICDITFPSLCFHPHTPPLNCSLSAAYLPLSPSSLGFVLMKVNDPVHRPL